MPRRRQPVAVADDCLMLEVAREVLNTIEWGIGRHVTEIPGVVSCGVERGLNGPHSVMLRVCVDHGGDRGQRLHFYTVKVTETTL